MQDIVLDTNILSEFLAQYFQQRQKGGHFTYHHFETTDVLNHRVVKEIRGIIKAYDYMRSHLVVASTFAFLEIARKFVEVSGNRFTIEQFSGFLDQPPEWFWVAPLDESLFLELLRIPHYVTMPEGQLKNIEWADAIHLATALSRENCLLATTDSRLKQLTGFQSHII
jgi:predicted nucleic acid-binding protein